MYRSIWAALFLSLSIYLIVRIKNNLSFTLKLFKPFIVSFLLVSIIGIVVDQQFSINLGNIIIVRLANAIGTADSVGRVTSSLHALAQSTTDLSGLIFGNGFGYQAFFVNDFGQGARYALQPTGSLSNFYVGFLTHFGFIGALLIITLFSILLRLYVLSGDFPQKSDQLFLYSYFCLQLLTFPTYSHYPVIMSLILLSHLIHFKYYFASSNK